MHFATLPDLRSEQDPDALGLADDPNGRLTNTEFLERVLTAAGHLSRAGVTAGDVVAVTLPNRSELVVILFAAWRLGAAATPVNPSLTPTEVGHQLADSAAKVVVCGSDDGRSRTRVRRGYPGGLRRAHRRQGACPGSRLLERGPGATGLHQRDHRTSQRCRAAALQHRGDGTVDDFGDAVDLCGPQPADPAAVPRERDCGQRARPIAGGKMRDNRRPLCTLDVLRPRRKDRPTYFSAVPAI